MKRLTQQILLRQLVIIIAVFILTALALPDNKQQAIASSVEQSRQHRSPLIRTRQESTTTTRPFDQNQTTISSTDADTVVVDIGGQRRAATGTGKLREERRDLQVKEVLPDADQAFVSCPTSVTGFWEPLLRAKRAHFILEEADLI